VVLKLSLDNVNEPSRHCRVLIVERWCYIDLRGDCISINIRLRGSNSNLLTRCTFVRVYTNDGYFNIRLRGSNSNLLTRCTFVRVYTNDGYLQIRLLCH